MIELPERRVRGRDRHASASSRVRGAHLRRVAGGCRQRDDRASDRLDREAALRTSRSAPRDRGRSHARSEGDRGDLRCEAPSPVQARYVARDVEHYGTVVAEGSVMVLLNSAGNRDERRCPDAQQFDIHREIGHHLSFGYGLHFCLGAALAPARGAAWRSTRCCSAGPTGRSTPTAPSWRTRPLPAGGKSSPS